MTKRPIVARAIAFCVMGGVAASMAISGAGPASASAGAAASSSTTKGSCAKSVCETVTLVGDRITVTTTASTTAKTAVRWCVKPSVTVRSPTTNLTVWARPFCDQTHPHYRFVLQLRNLSFPVTVTARWTHISGAPSVTFRQ